MPPRIFTGTVDRIMFCLQMCNILVMRTLRIHLLVAHVPPVMAVPPAESSMLSQRELNGVAQDLDPVSWV